MISRSESDLSNSIYHVKCLTALYKNTYASLYKKKNKRSFKAHVYNQIRCNSMFKIRETSYITQCKTMNYLYSYMDIKYLHRNEIYSN